MKAMLKKEIKEIMSTYRWLLLPAIFVLLGLTQPVTYKYMPLILKNSNLPPGSVLEIPMPLAKDVLTSALGQFNQMGLLMIILVVMGTVAQEKASGVSASVLVKPLGRGSYLAAKFTAYSLLTAVAYFLGFWAGAYYTNLLIGSVDWYWAFMGSLVYLPYLLVAVALTILTSTLFANQVAAGGTALISIMGLSLLPKLGEWSNKIFPGALGDQAGKIFGGEIAQNLWQPLVFSALLIIALLLAAWASLRKQEL